MAFWGLCAVTLGRVSYGLLYHPPEDFSGLGVSVGDVIEKKRLLLFSGAPMSALTP